MNNQVAIITGAANGLGKALAVELNRQGWQLALLDVDAIGLFPTFMHRMIGKFKKRVDFV
jgi:nucleoside-diphosphate-sugar epimerase